MEKTGLSGSGLLQAHCAFYLLLLKKKKRKRKEKQSSKGKWPFTKYWFRVNLDHTFHPFFVVVISSSELTTKPGPRL